MNGMDSRNENICFASRSHNFYSESMMYVGENSLALGHRGNYSAYKLYHGRLPEPVLPIYNHFLLKINSALCIKPYRYERTLNRLPLAFCVNCIEIVTPSNERF